MWRGPMNNAPKLVQIGFQLGERLRAPSQAVTYNLLDRNSESQTAVSKSKEFNRLCRGSIESIESMVYFAMYFDVLKAWQASHRSARSLWINAIKKLDWKPFARRSNSLRIRRDECLPRLAARWMPGQECAKRAANELSLRTNWMPIRNRTQVTTVTYLVAQPLRGFFRLSAGTIYRLV